MIRLPERLTGNRARPRGEPSIQVGAEPEGHHAREARAKLAELHGVAHLTPKEATDVLADKLRPSGASLQIIVVSLLVLLAVTLLGLALIPAMSGSLAAPSAGYVAATASWLMSTAQAAPLLAIVTRLSFGLWAAPVRRLAELYALAGLVTAPLIAWLLIQRPSLTAWSGVWFGWPGAWGWSVLAVALLAIAGLLLLAFSALPDFAAAHADDVGHSVVGWRGSGRQWQVLERGIAAFSILYLVLYIYVQLVVSTELALVLVPSWNSAVVPAQQIVSALAGGVALTLISLAVVRRAGAHRLVGLDPFWNGSKVLLGLAPISLYLTWAEVLTYWYGRTPREQWLLQSLMFGPPLILFVAELALLVVLPFLILIWHEARRSYLWPVVAGCAVIAGVFLNRVRVYGVSWTVATAELPPEAMALAGIAPGLRAPALVDWWVMLGAPLIVVLGYLAVGYVVPLISLWEYNRDRMLRVGRPFLQTAIAIIGRQR